MKSNTRVQFFFHFLFVGLFSALLLGLLYNKEYEVCENYDTQPEAQKAYQKGAKQLDGDNDKVACENLPVKKIVKYYK